MTFSESDKTRMKYDLESRLFQLHCFSYKRFAFYEETGRSVQLFLKSCPRTTRTRRRLHEFIRILCAAEHAG